MTTPTGPVADVGRDDERPVLQRDLGQTVRAAGKRSRGRGCRPRARRRTRSAGRADQLLGVADLDDAALDEDGDPVCQGSRVEEVVRDDDRRQVELAQERPQLGADLSAAVRIERGHRLVEQEDSGPAARALWRVPLADALLRTALPASPSPALRSRIARGGLRRRPRTRRCARPRGAGTARTPGRRSRPSAPRDEGRPGQPNHVSSPTTIVPRLGRLSPATASRTVVLPAPDGPTRATVSRPTSSATSTSKERSRDGEIESKRAHVKTLSQERGLPRRRRRTAR